VPAIWLVVVAIVALCGCAAGGGDGRDPRVDTPAGYRQRANLVCVVALGRFRRFAAEDASGAELRALSAALAAAASNLAALTPPDRLPPGYVHGTYAERQAMLVAALRDAARATAGEGAGRDESRSPQHARWRDDRVVLALALVRASANEPLRACAVGVRP